MYTYIAINYQASHPTKNTRQFKFKYLEDFLLVQNTYHLPLEIALLEIVEPGSVVGQPGDDIAQRSAGRRHFFRCLNDVSWA
jgi:hypothetical protein